MKTPSSHRVFSRGSGRQPVDSSGFVIFFRDIFCQGALGMAHAACLPVAHGPPRSEFSSCRLWGPSWVLQKLWRLAVGFSQDLQR